MLPGFALSTSSSIYTHPSPSVLSRYDPRRNIRVSTSIASRSPINYSSLLMFIYFWPPYFCICLMDPQGVKVVEGGKFQPRLYFHIDTSCINLLSCINTLCISIFRYCTRTIFRGSIIFSEFAVAFRPRI